MSTCSIWGPPQSGKTTLALNLAQGISRTEHSVCLIAPIEFSECSALLGVSIPDSNSLLAALMDEGSVRKSVFKVAKYFYLLAMPTDSDVYGSTFSEDSVRKTLVQADSAFDYIIVDCPASAPSLVSAWGISQSKHVFLCLGSNVSSPLWHNANRRAIRAIEHKITPIGSEVNGAFDYSSLYRLIRRDPKVKIPFIREAQVMQNEGHFLTNAGGRNGRAYVNALNQVFEVMQS
jgi:hypothetical protein